MKDFLDILWLIFCMAVPMVAALAFDYWLLVCYAQ